MPDLLAHCLYVSRTVLTLTPSRGDAYFGNNHDFNQTIFDQTRAYWTNETLTAEMLANCRMARQIQSKAFNPTYYLPALIDGFAFAELASPIVVFGDVNAGTVDRKLVEYFFRKFTRGTGLHDSLYGPLTRTAENERLPTELGWRRRESEVTLKDLDIVLQMLRAASSLTTPTKEDTLRGGRNLHLGARP
jgi:hypothetical protein